METILRACGSSGRFRQKQVDCVCSVGRLVGCDQLSCLLLLLLLLYVLLGCHCLLCVAPAPSCCAPVACSAALPSTGPCMFRPTSPAHRASPHFQLCSSSSFQTTKQVRRELLPLHGVQTKMGEMAVLLKESEGERGAGDTGVENHRQQTGLVYAHNSRGCQTAALRQGIQSTGPWAGGQKGLPGEGGVGCDLGLGGHRCWIGLE